MTQIKNLEKNILLIFHRKPSQLIFNIIALIQRLCIKSMVLSKDLPGNILRRPFHSFDVFIPGHAVANMMITRANCDLS